MTKPDVVFYAFFELFSFPSPTLPSAQRPFLSSKSCVGCLFSWIDTSSWFLAIPLWPPCYASSNASLSSRPFSFPRRLPPLTMPFLRLICFFKFNAHPFFDVSPPPFFTFFLRTWHIQRPCSFFLGLGLSSSTFRSCHLRSPSQLGHPQSNFFLSQVFPPFLCYNYAQKGSWRQDCRRYDFFFFLWNFLNRHPCTPYFYPSEKEAGFFPTQSFHATSDFEKPASRFPAFSFFSLLFFFFATKLSSCLRFCQHFPDWAV